MAWEAPVLDVTFPASADMTEKQFHVVYLSTAGKVVGTAGLLNVPLGVLQDHSTAANISCRVRVEGVSKVVAGGTSGMEMAIVPGQRLVSTGGAVIPSSSGAGNQIVGIALEALSTFSASTSYLPTIAMLIARMGATT